MFNRRATNIARPDSVIPGLSAGTEPGIQLGRRAPQAAVVGPGILRDDGR
jgi:hypothetical protein